MKNMRYLLASFVLSLLLTAGLSLPAAADPKVGLAEGSRLGTTNPSERPRLVRASYSEAYDDDEVRPRRRYHRNDGASRHRYTKRRHARVAKHARRHQRTARKPGISRNKVVHPRQKPAQRTVTAPAVPPATPPAWSKKGLDTDSQKRPGSRGMASFYWQPQALASGGRFNPNAMTAAHKTLPFGTRVRVTHMGNGRSVEVKINDRGPYVAGRIIDLSRAAAGVIGMTAQGVARVAVEVLGK
jgi:peptidoglycan lytic transglycosylase